jgi:eukaryotic-like serine/threonine-protein kinase
MGTVYRGERLKLGRPVAIKFLHPRLAREPQVVRRFEVEATAMSRLSHPNCVAVMDFGVDELPYLVMDLVQGTPLRVVLEQGRLPMNRALRIARQILAALVHAHAQGIIHRDIKPENILLEQTSGLEDHVRILDFGLAKLVGNDLQLTVGMAVGTPNYMAPEQLREGAVDERVDIYAAGVVLFEMLTGSKPFDAPQVGEVFVKQQTMPPPWLREILPEENFPQELESLLQRAMAKAPDDRFGSADAFAAALDALLEAGAPGPAAVRADPDKTLLDPLPAFEMAAGLSLPGSSGERGPAKSTSPEAIHRGTVGDLGPRPAAAGARVVRAFQGMGTITRKVGVAFGGAARWMASTWRRRIAAAAGLAALLVALSILLSPREVPPPVAPEAAASAQAPEQVPAEAPLVAAAGGGGAGARDEAIARLRKLRRAEPRNADHAAALAALYFEKRWWSEGLSAFRAATQLDPKYKSDPVLIGHVISSLQSDRIVDRASTFLRELGPAAKPHLQDAAKNHPSPRVRARAAEILRASGRRPFLRWR